MIDSLRGLAKLNERTAAIAAPMLEGALRATASAGTSPDGQAWAPKKDGGGRPYAGAAKAISAKAIGDVVRVTLEGPEVFGHFGARGAPKRLMIPQGGGSMPAVVAKVLDKASAQAFDEITGGRS